MTLFVDTAGQHNRLALLGDGKILAECDLPARGTSEVIISELEGLLGQVSAKKEEIEKILTVAGPGSFTGLRVGLAFANALALGLEVPIAGVPTGSDPIRSLGEVSFERQWLRPDYGGEPHVTLSKKKR